VTSTAEQSEVPVGDRLRHAWLVFTVTWSIAVLFHVAGNTRLAPEWGRAVLGVAAVALLARPGSRRLASVLAVAVLVNVWLEAPLLSNHWLLHGLIAMIVLGGAGLVRGHGGDAMARMLGPLRLLLLAFYLFAAVAKLNTDFFDPLVSCGVFYLEESVTSWGLGGLVEGWSSSAQRVVAIAVAGIELTIPFLLVVRRTRAIGVVAALSFHFVLALDRTHQFFDFSAVLTALFLLFLPSSGISGIVARVDGLRATLANRWPSGSELLRLVGLAGAALVVLIASGPGEWPAPPLLRGVGVAAWIVYGAGTIAIVAGAARRADGPVERLLPVRPPLLLLAVPALAVLNGLMPYLEVKSAASWNMYSNLAVVDGESNHLLVPGGVALTDAHERLVEITAAEGINLDFYIDTDWRVPEVMLTDHLADRPGTVVNGLVAGDQVRYEGGAGGARPLWQRKFQVFRAVDGEGPVGCQPAFGPLR
jgi:hypothetical protein